MYIKSLLHKPLLIKNWRIWLAVCRYYTKHFPKVQDVLELLDDGDDWTNNESEQSFEKLRWSFLKSCKIFDIWITIFLQTPACCECLSH